MFTDFRAVAVRACTLYGHIRGELSCWDILYGLKRHCLLVHAAALSLEQKKREKIGAFARICAEYRPV
jgi:hypothetical protein